MSRVQRAACMPCHAGGHGHLRPAAVAQHGQPAWRQAAAGASQHCTSASHGSEAATQPWAAVSEPGHEVSAKFIMQAAFVYVVGPAMLGPPFLCNSRSWMYATEGHWRKAVEVDAEAWCVRLVARRSRAPQASLAPRRMATTAAPTTATTARHGTTGRRAEWQVLPSDVLREELQCKFEAAASAYGLRRRDNAPLSCHPGYGILRS